MAVIGVFDSGSGGLSVLKELIKQVPGAHYIYYSDNAHCPYGNKGAEFIIERSREIAGLLLQGGVDAIVVACNTATSAAVAQLRKEISIPIIGMEPAVKPAVAATRSGVVGVLATAATLKGSKYQTIKEKYESDAVVIERYGAGFVELVESLELSGSHAEDVVRASLQPLIDAGADTIVLGCTHYPFLLPLMRKIAPPDVVFVDPAPAIAKRLSEVLKINNIPVDEAERQFSSTQVELISSGPDDSLLALYDTLFSSVSLPHIAR